MDDLFIISQAQTFPIKIHIHSKICPLTSLWLVYLFREALLTHTPSNTYFKYTLYYC